MSENKKIPEIRFKGVSGEWDHKKLQDLTETGFSNGVFNDPQKVGKGYRLINVKDMYSGDSIHIENLSLLDLDEKEFKNNKVEYGDIFFTRSSLVKEGIAYSNVNLSDRNDITFDGHLIRMQPCKATTNPVFLACLFKTPSAREQFILGGKTTTMTTIGQSDIATVALSLPCKQEQTKIGTIFQNLNTLINQHQQKHDKLSNIKKAMLAKMFPKQGETIPEIRFKGFNVDWEESNLEKCTALLTGNPFNSKEFTSEGYFLVRGMNVKRGYLDSSPEISEFWPSSKGLERYILEPEDIVIQMDGALIGKSYAKINSRNLPAILVQRVTRVRCSEVNPEFIYQYIQRDFLTHISGIKTETAVPHLSLHDIRAFSVFLPERAEQNAIGDYFQNLDALINQHQQQITKLNHVKQACLGKMFV
ncbi:MULTISPECIES: restriction endonuclease subunit S [Pseudoalteromonas]|uniref:restriction endonuclease subunit S n=1 Tax=Pseudoalteromonas TaxID=53246 RepID=UPI0025B61BCF|nr:restriction endonuclease subunit S [Pseudoalteromonas sp. APC 3694]MDN3488538.1 restriction endonuclease subunit S [Pseudoalteromonas sp. APC 3694]